MNRTPLWRAKTKKQKRQAYEALKRWRAKNADRFNRETRLSLHLRRSIPYRRAWPLIVEHYGSKCLNCGASEGLCFDHVTPLAAGGENQLTNGQPLCRKCNTFKGQLQGNPADWRPDKGAWITELVKRNPQLVIAPAGKRYLCLTKEERAAVAERQTRERDWPIV